VLLPYAYDIALIAITGLRKLLQICESYVDMFDVKFNADKSQCMVVSPQYLQPVVKREQCVLSPV